MNAANAAVVERGKANDNINVNMKILDLRKDALYVFGVRILWSSFLPSLRHAKKHEVITIATHVQKALMLIFIVIAKELPTNDVRCCHQFYCLLCNVFLLDFFHLIKNVEHTFFILINLNFSIPIIFHR